MKIYDDSKIYIFAPMQTYTGGPLSLHQLASALKRMNYDVYMFYGSEFNSNFDPVHPRLKNFHLPVAYEIEDSPRNIFILSETSIMIQKLRSQIVIWWLSVDFYFKAMSDQIQYYIQQQDFLRMPLPIFNVLDDPEFDHFVQSEYARQFLRVNRVPDEKVHFIRDYITPIFSRKTNSIDINSKENIIAYNPKKGTEFTQKIIESAPDLNFIPIENMSSDEVQNLLSRSKVYIDFGTHPGRDRIPREAVLSHCIIITSRRGSADNPIDVPIDDDFKFVDDPKNIPNIIEKIKYVFENFQAEHDRQNSYRDIILNEQNKFFNEVDSVFKNKNLSRIHVAIIGNLQEIEEVCEQLLPYRNDVEIVFVVNDSLAGREFYLEDQNKIAIISTEDAEFLWYEKRIDQFIMRRKT